MSTSNCRAGERQPAEAEWLTSGDVARLAQTREKSVDRNPPPGRVRLGRSVRFVAADGHRWIAAGRPPVPAR